jgi:hypothetical protein
MNLVFIYLFIRRGNEGRRGKGEEIGRGEKGEKR